MPKNREARLEDEFLRLLQEADPEVTENDPLAVEFASHLAMLTDDWATGSPKFAARERWIIHWIEENTGRVPELAVSGGDEFEFLEEAGADAGVDA